MPELHEIGVMVSAWLCIAVVAGIVLLPLRRARQVPDAPTPRLFVPSGGLVVAGFLVVWLMPAFVLPLLPSPDKFAAALCGPGADATMGKMLSMVVASIIALPLQILAWRALRIADAKTAPDRTPPVTIARNLWWGYRTWLVLTPAVFVTFLIAAALYTMWFGKPDQHPLLAPFLHAPVPFIVLALLVVEAVLAAPIREELVFRGILLPWMADRDWRGDAGLLFAALAIPVLRFADGKGIDAIVSGAAASLGIALTLFVLGRFIESRCADWLLPNLDPAARRNAVRGIVGAAAIFAVCHMAVAPTPAPLSLLALGLGWLALRTQGLAGPILVHALFNAVAFAEISFR